MARRKGTGRKYTKAQKLEVLKRVQAGETQVAVAASAGVPLATVGYWTRKAKSPGAANGATRPTAKRGRSAGSRNRATTATSAPQVRRNRVGAGWRRPSDPHPAARVRAADRGRGAEEDLTL